MPISVTPAPLPPVSAQRLGTAVMRVDKAASKAAFATFPGAEAELDAKRAHFQKLWSTKGQRLLRTAANAIGLPFTKDIDLSLMVSTTEPSRGWPDNKIQINVVSFLKASSSRLGMPAPLDDEQFVALVLHEVLHKYVDNNQVQERSAVLRSVPPAWLVGMQNPTLVYAHLHSFALEQLAYTSLGQHTQLAKARLQDESFNPEYKRAWEIVTTGLAGPYLINEMRQLARAPATR